MGGPKRIAVRCFFFPWASLHLLPLTAKVKSTRPDFESKVSSIAGFIYEATCRSSKDKHARLIEMNGKTTAQQRPLVQQLIYLSSSWYHQHRDFHAGTSKSEHDRACPSNVRVVAMPCIIPCKPAGGPRREECAECEGQAACLAYASKHAREERSHAGRQ